MSTRIPELELTLDGGALPDPATGTDVYVEGNDGNVVIRAVNPTGADKVITLEATATFAGHTVGSKEVTVPANGERWLKPLPPAVYNDDVGDAHISDPSGAIRFTGLRF